MLLSSALLVFLLADITTAERFSVEQVYVPPNCTYKSTYGDYLKQDYVGTLFDLTIFDASKLRRQTFDFHIGVGAAIEGVEIGMLGMCKGEKRRFVIPPWLAYGYENYGDIPGGSTLYFDVLLTDLFPKGFRTETIKAPENCTRKVAQGDRIHEHYRAYVFGNATPFDDSYARKIPSMFTVGTGQMIRAIDYGVVGMCPGEIRRIITPGILAWGATGIPNLVPPHAAVILEIELLWIETGTLVTKKLDGPRCFTGNSVQPGDTVTVNYTGSSESGATFRSNSFQFSTDKRGILQGLAQGVIGMCVDEVRQLIIPPELAYGTEPGGIPQGVRLTIEVRLLNRISPSTGPATFPASAATAAPSSMSTEAPTTALPTTLISTPMAAPTTAPTTTSTTTPTTTSTTTSTSPPTTTQSTITATTPTTTPTTTSTTTPTTTSATIPTTTSTTTSTAAPTTTSTAAPTTTPAVVSVPASIPEDLSKLFDKINTYPDMFIGHDEIDAWIRDVRKVSQGSAEFLKLKLQYFTNKDKDRNGWVTRAEFIA